jgi:hypothetical protein
LTSLRFTLLSDGSSDRVLLPVLGWLLQQHSARSFQPQWADLRKLPEPPRTLPERVRAAVELYPCDLLFVHRDAERESRELRVREIRQHLGRLPDHPVVCVVPVRMQEAWFLFDETSLREAADNPRGHMALALPPLGDIEAIPDPKNLVHDLLRSASGLRPGRLRRFHPATRVHRLAELIEDFSPLRGLSAFQALERDLRSLLEEKSWL